MSVSELGGMRDSFFFMTGQFQNHKRDTLSDKNSADKIAENLAWRRKFCPPKNFVRRKFCPPNFWSAEFLSRSWLSIIRVFMLLPKIDIRNLLSRRTVRMLYLGMQSLHHWHAGCIDSTNIYKLLLMFSPMKPFFQFGLYNSANWPGGRYFTSPVKKQWY